MHQPPLQLDLASLSDIAANASPIRSAKHAQSTPPAPPPPAAAEHEQQPPPHQQPVPQYPHVPRFPSTYAPQPHPQQYVEYGHPAADPYQQQQFQHHLQPPHTGKSFTFAQPVAQKTPSPQPPMYPTLNMFPHGPPPGAGPPPPAPGGYPHPHAYYPPPQYHQPAPMPHMHAQHLAPPHMMQQPVSPGQQQQPYYYYPPAPTYYYPPPQQHSPAPPPQTSIYPAPPHPNQLQQPHMMPQPHPMPQTYTHQQHQYPHPPQPQVEHPQPPPTEASVPLQPASFSPPTANSHEVGQQHSTTRPLSAQPPPQPLPPPPAYEQHQLPPSMQPPPPGYIHPSMHHLAAPHPYLMPPAAPSAPMPAPKLEPGMLPPSAEQTSSADESSPSSKRRKALHDAISTPASGESPKDGDKPSLLCRHECGCKRRGSDVHVLPGPRPCSSRGARHDHETNRNLHPWCTNSNQCHYLIRGNKPSHQRRQMELVAQRQVQSAQGKQGAVEMTPQQLQAAGVPVHAQPTPGHPTADSVKQEVQAAVHAANQQKTESSHAASADASSFTGQPAVFPPPTLELYPNANHYQPGQPQHRNGHPPHQQQAHPIVHNSRPAPSVSDSSTAKGAEDGQPPSAAGAAHHTARTQQPAPPQPSHDSHADDTESEYTPTGTPRQATPPKSNTPNHRQ